MQKVSLLRTKILFSCSEFSRLSGLSLRTITKLVAAREIDSIRVGRRRLIPRIALVRFSQRSHSTHSAPRQKVGR
jgi:excisionase family DNA binding protein